MRRQKAHHCFLYFIKLFYILFVDIVSAQIKVDPLELRMMYYSYFYEQKLQRKLFPLKKLLLIALVPPCPAL